MNMSFSEKSAWLSFIITLAIWGKYVFEVLQLGGSALNITEQRALALSMLAYATLFVIIAESVFHAIIAMANPSDANQVGDERDKSISNKATSAAYGILFTGVIITIVHLLIFEYFPEISANSSLQIPFLSAHILIIFGLLSELGRFGYMIGSYRKEA